MSCRQLSPDAVSRPVQGRGERPQAALAGRDGHDPAAELMMVQGREAARHAHVLGARGAYGLMSPKSALNDWWWDLYSKAYNVYPVQAPYRMVQSLLGLKRAIEKAMAHPRQVARPVRGEGGAGGTGGSGGVLNLPRMPAVRAQRNRKENAFFSAKSALPFSFSQ